MDDKELWDAALGSILEQFPTQGKALDILTDVVAKKGAEYAAAMMLCALEVGKILKSAAEAGVHYADIMRFTNEALRQMTADKAGTAGNENLHQESFFFFEEGIA